MRKNEDGDYNYRGWSIVPEFQDVNGRRIRKGMWLCFAPGAQKVTFAASTLQKARVAIFKVENW